MRFGQFSLTVKEGVERGTSGYVHLRHGQQYTLMLGNHCGRRCQADVSIDGKEVGKFVLDHGGVFPLETKPDDGGRFTFYADGTVDASCAGLEAVPQQDRGLVVVTFTPEKGRLPRPTMSTLRSAGGGQQTNPYRGGVRGQSMSSYEPPMEEKTSGGLVGGGTGMSGVSSQTFREVNSFPLEEQEATTISLRLVLLDEGPRPLTPALPVPRGNAVPPPVAG